MVAQSVPVGTSSPADGTAALVSGASFAGLATAFWMNRLGYRVTVVEVTGGVRKGGTPVDIEGETIDILSRMGVMDAVRAKSLPPRKFEFRSANDALISVMDHGSIFNAHEKYEIHRDDLLDILFRAIEDSVEIVFGQSIQKLEDGPDGVAVTFDDESRRDYALVAGCDGNRSRTRRLAFGEADDSFFMGGYVYIKVVPTTGFLPANVSQLFNTPGRAALLNGYEDQTDIFFAFRSDHEIDYDHRDRAQQRRMIHDHFDGLGWKVPAMLDCMGANDDFYFDKLNQIRMPCWSRGRIVLVGDAGYCVSPMAGMGGSMAIIGAARLADALQRHGDDYGAAFEEYEDNLRPFVEEVQEKAFGVGLGMMCPADDGELAERNQRLAEGGTRT